MTGGINPIPTNPVPTAGTGAAQPIGQTIGGGIGGIASKVEQEGIKRYNDKKKYNEWEFVYDITKDPTRTRRRGSAGVHPPRGLP